MHRILEKTKVALYIVGVSILVACTPITPGDSKPQISVPSGSVNVAQAAGLEQTTEIDIGVFDPTAATPYPSAAVVKDAAAIAEIVSLLDADLPVGPAAACMDAYRLRFRLSDGSVQEFDYFCEPDASLLSTESVSELRGKSIQAPAELGAIIQEKIQ